MGDEGIMRFYSFQHQAIDNVESRVAPRICKRFVM